MSVKIDSIYVDKLREGLTYKNTSAEYEYNRLKQSKWMASRYGHLWFKNKLEESRQRITHCLLFEGPNGYWTYTGLCNVIEELFPGNVVVENNLTYPESRLLPWHTPMKNELRYYQTEAVKALIEAKHGAIAAATGSGKTSTLTQVVKELGLQTVVAAPSISIVEQIYKNFKINFGKKKVGRFDGTKKESDKQIVVAVAQSLSRVEENSEHWDNFRRTQVFIADESHLFAAETLQKVCFGVFANTPYRFFTSATQIRNDGQKLLLDAIIGPIVHEYTIEQAIKDNYLVPMVFKMVRCKTENKNMANDPNEITRDHLYYNPKVIEKAAEIANNAVSTMGRKVLILIEEIEQFWHISNKLNHKYEFAHGGNLNQKQKDMIQEKYRNPDNNQLVEEFNAGSIPILIGTSCISTGTDIRAADFIIYLQGGKSEVQIKQSIGRGTRLFPGKKNCIVVDFDVDNCHITHRHALERKKIYQQIGDFQYVEM